MVHCLWLPHWTPHSLLNRRRAAETSRGGAAASTTPAAVAAATPEGPAAALLTSSSAGPRRCCIVLCCDVVVRPATHRLRSFSSPPRATRVPTARGLPVLSMLVISSAPCSCWQVCLRAHVSGLPPASPRPHWEFQAQGRFALAAWAASATSQPLRVRDGHCTSHWPRQPGGHVCVTAPSRK